MAKKLKNEVKEETCNLEKVELKLDSNMKLIIIAIAVSVACLILSLVAVNKTESIYKLLKGTDETAEEYNVSKFTAIDAEGLETAFNGKNLSVVLLARETCSYCVKFSPVINQANTEYKLKTLYLDITKPDSAGVAKIKALDTFFNTNYGRTPIVVLVKDGKVIDSQIGYSDYATFASFLEKNGFKK